MSHPLHPSVNEHKTTQSYIIGFILSLIFTFIPTYLVMQHIISGSSLLATILGFGVLQMIVQVVFFLHLGRGPKPFYNVAFFIATIGAILVVAVGSVVIIGNLHSNMKAADQVKKLINDEGIYQVGNMKTGACQGQHTSHIVTIKNGLVAPIRTLALRCDTLTIVNNDKITRNIAFGTHPDHQSYAGNSELAIRKGLSKTVTLSEAGTYEFHDHLHPETAGSFTVVP